GHDESLFDRVPVDAERKADRQRDHGHADGEAHAKAPPLPRHALALAERRLQRVDAPLKLDLARVVFRSCKQCHAKSLRRKPRAGRRGGRGLRRQHRAKNSWGGRGDRAPPPPRWGGGGGGGGGLPSLCSCPLPNPPAEVGSIRLRPVKMWSNSGKPEFGCK